MRNIRTTRLIRVPPKWATGEQFMESLYNYQDIMKRYGVAFSSFANFDRKGLLPPATCKRAGCRFWSSEALAIFEQNCIDFVNARKGKQGKTFSFIKNGKVITQEK